MLQVETSRRVIAYRWHSLPRAGSWMGHLDLFLDCGHLLHDFAPRIGTLDVVCPLCSESLEELQPTPSWSP